MYARPDWAAIRPGLALLAVCLLPLLLPDSATTLLEYQRNAIASGQLWRLWTGHLVHYSAAHAGLDGLACLVLAVGLQQVEYGRVLALRLACIAPLLSLAIFVAAPEMQYYRGASGLVMAMLAAVWLTLWRAQRGWRVVLFLLAAALLIKLAADALYPAQTISSLPAGIKSAWQVHLAGLIGGIIFWWRSDQPAVLKPTDLSLP